MLIELPQALNMAYGEEQNAHSVPLAFEAATRVPGFKLFFSFDYAGYGARPMQVRDYPSGANPTWMIGLTYTSIRNRMFKI